MDIIAPVIVSLITGAAALFASELRSKGRAEATTASTKEKIDGLQAKVDRLEDNDERCKLLEVKHEGLEKIVNKLESDKASKEAVDAMRREFEAVREDLSTRFDRMEDLIRSLFSKKG